MRQRDVAYIKYLEKENKKYQKALEKILKDQELTKAWWKIDMKGYDGDRAMVEWTTKNIRMLKKVLGYNK